MSLTVVNLEISFSLKKSAIDVPDKTLNDLRSNVAPTL
jgi:hypothetical protein